MKRRALTRCSLSGGLLALAWSCAHAAIVMPPDTAAPPSSGAAPAPGPSIQLPEARADERAVPADLLQRALAGDTPAMVSLGHYYYLHPSLPQAATQARRWWLQAAQAGDARGMAALGYLLGERSGASNLPAARQWLERASALGFTRALYLRSRLARGAVGPRETRQAQPLLEQAAREGDVMALNDLGVERELAGDTRGAAELYQRAAKAGLDVGRQNSERLSRAENPGGEDSLRRLRTLADEGDADALLALAQRYHRGDGVQRDFARAIQYYQRAADAGSARAREFLALIFSRSGGVQGAAVNEAWMQELAARANAATMWSQARRAPALNRPTRVDDPLVDLVRPLGNAAPTGR